MHVWTLVFASIGVVLSLTAAGKLVGLVRSGEIDRPQVWVCMLVAPGLVAGTSSWLVGRTWYVIAISGLLTATLVILFAARGARHSNTGRTGSALWIAVGLWGWLFLTNAAINGDAVGWSVFSRLLPGVLLVCFAIVGSRFQLSPQAVSLAGAMAVGLSLVVSPAAPNAWRACDEFKCGVLGAMLRGPYSSENYLAYQAVIVGLLALVFLSGTTRFITTLATLSVLVATESRTSQLAYAVGLALWATARLVHRLQPRATHGTGSAMLRLLLPVLTTVVALILITTATPSSFSNRGNIWVRAWAALEGHRLAGLGLQRWDVLQSGRVLPDHYPHSEYLLILFSGGFIGLIILVAWAVRSSHVAGTQLATQLQALVLPAGFLIAGLAEIVWNPLAVDGLLWTALAVSTVAANLRDAPTTVPVTESSRQFHE
jgi:O-antigen ligase